MRRKIYLQFNYNQLLNCLTESARMLSQNRRLHLLITEAELSLTAPFLTTYIAFRQKIRRFRFTIVKVCFLG
ncbi:MAG: hypothetical protein EWV63_02030 [Microcystis aeruginosa Ma_OC_H_19870700_S124]|uniref:Uncharacterized protein n=1 Tax=Microcystis aeruginosa Ma_OC_H_19870700_S124 TaxID=2486262 RepID=A0A552AXD4_MICAE|nr:MAG: hypothetical protein EWV63_02030 [Microcystis aeruginosa Ma_OC_H_19870700_S124]